MTPNTPQPKVSFWSKFGKLLASFATGAAAGAVGAVSMGQTNPTMIGISAGIAGLAMATGHAIPSPFQPPVQQ